MKAHFLYSLVVCFMVILNSFCQNKLTVFKMEGHSMSKMGNNAFKTLHPGQSLQQDEKLKITSGGLIFLIDVEGELYELTKAGTYTLSEVLKHHKKTSGGSVSKKYLKYVYANFMNAEEKKETVQGGVFRGETLMLLPPDSAKVVFSKLKFTWQTADKDVLYYLFIRNPMTEEVLKFETNGSQLALYKNHPFFSVDNNYEWTVTEQAFPSLKNLKFYSFSLIQRNAFEKAKEPYTALIADLKEMRYSENEILEILCKTYGLCR